MHEHYAVKPALGNIGTAMKILVLGAEGMLGHQLVRELGTRHVVTPAARRDADLRDPAALHALIAKAGPAAVINAAGVIPQRPGSADALENLEMNAMLPQRLAGLCREHGARLLHVSTDCVFSGEQGNYRESDRPDPVDLYGRTKLLGEAEGPGVQVLRTSLIGASPARRTGLVEWFLSQRGPVQGYKNAIFSGVTTREFARVAALLLEGPAAAGLYHLSAAPISKFDLLSHLGERLGLTTQILPAAEPRIDRSLDSARFRADFSYEPPPWEAMLDELAAELKAR
jgi:dTDP-4-dehydrorhamnose reductase